MAILMGLIVRDMVKMIAVCDYGEVVLFLLGGRITGLCLSLAVSVPE